MLDEIRSAFACGSVIPYLGPGVLALAGESCPLPASPEALAAKLTSVATVPHKIRRNLTAAAQFIENFKHRKTVTTAMRQAFTADLPPTVLHEWLASGSPPPIVVNAWYDDLLQKAFAGRTDWGVAQGVSQAEHSGEWVHYFRVNGSQVPLPQRVRDASGAKAPADAPLETLAWATLLYQPLGCVTPAANFIVSDSDYVEVLTEIDIQTPIPETVQRMRAGRSFLFLGCRFCSQLERGFARQIMKRSSNRHWAVLPDRLTRNEERFLQEQNISRVESSLEAFVTELMGSGIDAAAEPAVA